MHFKNYIAVSGVDQDECRMAQSSSPSCVVCGQGAGLWAPVGVTFVPFSAVPSVLCWALSSCSPGISLPSPMSVFLCVSTSTLPSLYTCFCKHPVPPVYTRVRPQLPLLSMFPHIPLHINLPQCFPQCVSCASWLSLFPKYMWARARAAPLPGCSLGYLQQHQLNPQDLLLSDLAAPRHPNLPLRSNTWTFNITFKFC